MNIKERIEKEILRCKNSKTLNINFKINDIKKMQIKLNISDKLTMKELSIAIVEKILQ